MPKAVVFLGDGMADEAVPALGGKTPLEAVDTPAMDSIAAEGVSGTFRTLPEGLPTSSDVANMSVLGFYPEENYPGRGPIEAVSQGIKLGPEDVAWRCNLVTVTPDGILKDYSAGHIDDAVSRRLMTLLEEKLGSDKVTFHPGVSYRNLLVLHGAEFSADVDYFKPDASQDIPMADCPLTAKTPAAEATVAFLQDLGRKAHEVLANAGIESAATDIWPWSPGYAPALKSFEERYAGKRGAIISAVDVIRGLGRASGMTVADVSGATGFLDTNYAGKVAAALEMLKSHDLVYVHVEAVDECSHMGDLALKMQAIKAFDEKIVAPILDALKGQDVNFAVLPDHPVPIHLRLHTVTPVPVAMCGPSFPCDGVKTYGETAAQQGSLGFRSGDELMKLLLGLKTL